MAEGSFKGGILGTRRNADSRWCGGKWRAFGGNALLPGAWSVGAPVEQTADLYRALYAGKAYPTLSTGTWVRHDRSTCLKKGGKEAYRHDQASLYSVDFGDGVRGWDGLVSAAPQVGRTGFGCAADGTD